MEAPYRIRLSTVTEAKWFPSTIERISESGRLALAVA